MAKQTTQTRSAVKKTLRAIGFNEHLEFFDENQDHKISILESKKGLGKLGFGHLLAVPAALAINFGLSGLGLVQGRPLNPANLALPRTGFVRHPDTDLIDELGEFDDTRLDAVFAKYGKRYGGRAVTLGELTALIGARVLEDARKRPRELLLLPVGATAVAVEWGALFWVAGTRRKGPGEGEAAGTMVLEKDTVRRFYTDSKFFHEVARRIAEDRATRGKTPLGAARNLVQTWLF